MVPRASPAGDPPLKQSGPARHAHREIIAAGAYGGDVPAVSAEGEANDESCAAPWANVESEKAASLSQPPGLLGAAVEREKAGPSLSQDSSSLQADDRVWIEVRSGSCSCPPGVWFMRPGHSSSIVRVNRAVASSASLVYFTRWNERWSTSSPIGIPDAYSDSKISRCCFRRTRAHSR